MGGSRSEGSPSLAGSNATLVVGNENGAGGVDDVDDKCQCD